MLPLFSSDNPNVADSETFTVTASATSTEQQPSTDTSTEPPSTSAATRRKLPILIYYQRKQIISNTEST